MTQEDMNNLYNEFCNTGVPISFPYDLTAFRLGAGKFADFMLERVDVKAVEPPKEG